MSPAVIKLIAPRYLKHNVVKKLNATLWPICECLIHSQSVVCGSSTVSVDASLRPTLPQRAPPNRQRAGCQGQSRWRFALMLQQSSQSTVTPPDHDVIEAIRELSSPRTKRLLQRDRPIPCHFIVDFRALSLSLSPRRLSSYTFHASLILKN